MSTNSDDTGQDLSDWISQAEAARIHGVTRQAIHKLVQNGRLRALRVGGHVLVSRSGIESFSRLSGGHPRPPGSKELEQIRRWIAEGPPEAKAELFQLLRRDVPIHPLESRLGVSAEVILEAIARAGDLTLRMIRGVIAEAAFEVHVVQSLGDWSSLPLAGNPPYDFLLRDAIGPVRVQVKLQRSQGGVPLKVGEGSRRLAAGMYIVETQRTRGGKDRSTGISTRPYRYDEFDVLAVAMQPSAGKWESFMYTVAGWLIPGDDPSTLAVLQPVAIATNEDWTDDFERCVAWLRSGVKKTIAGRRPD